MNDLRGMLTSNDKDLIEKYIDNYVMSNDDGEGYVHYDRRASVDTVLRPWAEAKGCSPLGLMFKNSLIVSENIEFKTPEAELYRTLDKDPRIWAFENEFHTFINKLEYVLYPLRKTDTQDREWYAIYDCLWDLVNHGTIIKNRYDGLTVRIPTPNGHELIVPNGCKPVKILGKLNQAYNISEKFEEYRIAVSMCLNVKTIKGNLCLSIHPMDFMTMSDNDCDWDSCMSWRNYGSYRQGTVEMMNSPYVCVAYLAAKEPMITCGHEWSNKKWRSLYIVHPDYIGNIKGYPYQIPEVDKMIIQKLKDMMQNAGFNAKYGEIKSYDYDSCDRFKSEHGEVSIRFYTHYMYNDFGSIIHYACVREDDKATNRIEITYSGVSECMWCGREYEGETEEGLACEYCCESTYCDCCGNAYHPASLFETGDGEWVCESCLDEYYSKSFEDDQYYRTENMGRVFVVPDELKEAIENKELDPMKFDWDIPHILDHMATDIRPECTYYCDQFKRLMVDDAEIKFAENKGWWGTKFIPYIFLSELKETWRKDFIGRYGYCYNVLGNNFYSQWSWACDGWSDDLAAEKWEKILEEKIPD